MGAGAWAGRAGSQESTAAPARSRDQQSWQLGPQLLTAVAAFEQSQCLTSCDSGARHGGGSGSVLCGRFSLGSAVLVWLGGMSGWGLAVGTGQQDLPAALC